MTRLFQLDDLANLQNISRMARNELLQSCLASLFYKQGQVTIPPATTLQECDLLPENGHDERKTATKGSKAADAWQPETLTWPEQVMEANRKKAPERFGHMPAVEYLSDEARGMRGFHSRSEDVEGRFLALRRRRRTCLCV